MKSYFHCIAMRERNRWLGSRKRNLLLTVLFPIFKDFLNNLDHMKNEVERPGDKTGEPSIAEMTENAIHKDRYFRRTLKASSC